MASPDGIRSAFDGRAARAAFEETAEFDPAQFLPVDYAALEGPWSSLGDDVARAGEFGMAGLIDDDVAFARPWGFELADVPVPVLVVQGEEDRVVPRSHGEWMARQLPRAGLVLRPGDGHISVLAAVPDALDWLLRQGYRGPAEGEGQTRRAVGYPGRPGESESPLRTCENSVGPR